MRMFARGALFSRNADKTSDKPDGKYSRLRDQDNTTFTDTNNPKIHLNRVLTSRTGRQFDWAQQTTRDTSFV